MTLPHDRTDPSFTPRPGRGARSTARAARPAGMVPAVAPAQPEEGIVEAVWRILRRRWLVILASTLLFVALAVGWSATQEKQYTASASLLFGTASENILDTGGFEDPARVQATNEALLALDVVSEETAERLNGRLSPEGVSGAVSVVPDKEGNLVDVRATTPNPQLSADIANAYGRAFISFRQRSQRDQIQGAIDLARRGQATLTPEQRRGEEGQALADRINQLETAKALQTGGAELVQPAGPPAEPSAPETQRNGILGGVLGLLIGFGLASLLERRDRAVKSVDDLESLSGWPVLARIPTSRSIRRGEALPARSAEQEAFRMLRVSLRYFKVNVDIRSLLITSARSGEGKSTTARRLAETMAEMGDRVVLVQADMHRAPKASNDLELGGRGLSGFLIGLDLEDVLVEVPVGGAEGRSLTMLPSGPLPPNPSELLESGRMHELMDELEDRFDVVIIDSPPLPILSDAVTLLGHVSGVIVVTAVGTTTPDDLSEVSRQMELMGGSVLGLVANFAPDSDRTGGYYAERA